MKKEIRVIEKKLLKVNDWINKAIKGGFKNNELILSFLYKRQEILEADLELIS
jgi:hypothetical protein